MGYQTALAAIVASGITDPAQQLAWAQTTLYAYESYFVSYRTLDGMMANGAAVFTTAQVNAIEAFVTSQNARFNSYMLSPGGSDGSGGGVDISLPEVQALLNAIPGAVQSGITQDMVNQVLALAQTSAVQRFAQWALASIDANTLANLSDRATWEAMSQDVDTWLNAANGNASAVAAMLGVTTQQLSANNAAMVASVQQWKTTVESNGSISGMPTTAAAMWAAVKGAS